MEAIKKEIWYMGFFYSLEKSSPKTMGELIKKAEKYTKLDNTSRVKRQQNPRFNKKKATKEKIRESSEK